MHTQKVAITIPKNLVVIIDTLSKQKGVSRSKFISSVLQEKILTEKDRQLKDAYDRIFSDKSIEKEQLETSKWLEGVESKKGQEW